MMGKDQINKDKKFKRIESESWVGGVCAGIAYYLECPTWVVRLIALVLITSTGIGVTPYLLLWFFVPDYDKTPEDYEVVTE